MHDRAGTEQGHSKAHALFGAAVAGMTGADRPAAAAGIPELGGGTVGIGDRALAAQIVEAPALTVNSLFRAFPAAQTNRARGGRLAEIAGNMQAHFGAAARLGADTDFRADFFRALVHHAQSDMLAGLGFGAAFRVEALPVVAHGYGEAVTVFQQHFSLLRGGVFADVGQGFLQNKQRLCLLLAVEQAVAAANVQHHRDAGLLTH